jgi:PTH1 family peptidyl-tRNA hydrolase
MANGEAGAPGSPPAPPEEPAGIRLVVGLGNPGREFEDTPHNLGFLVVDRMAARNGIRVNRKTCLALVGEGEVAGRKVVLAKPQTYMNRSGQAVRRLLQEYGMEPRQMLVIYDDLDLPWRTLRIRPKGSAGGHHGMESVGFEIGTMDFARLRLGIAGYRVADGAKYVLSRFTREQKKELDELLDLAAQAAESVISEGVEKSMTKFNRRARGETTEEE